MFRILVLFCLLAVPSAAYAAVSDAVKSLKGYATMTVSDAFAAYLDKNRDVLRKLQGDEALSRLVLSRAALQNQLMKKETTLADIEKQYFAENKVKQQPAIKQQATPQAPHNKAPHNQTPEQTEIRNAIAALRENEASPAEMSAELDRLIDEFENSHQTPSDVLRQALNDPHVRAQLDSGELPVEQLLTDLGITHAQPEPQPEQPTAEVVQPQVTEPEVVVAQESPVDEEPTITRVDINARPAPAEAMQKDANGWPQYLQAPADCAPPQAGTQYIHAFLYGIRGVDPKRLLPEARLQGVDPRNTFVKNYFYINGNPGYLYMNTRQALAVPFIYNPGTPDSYGYFSDAHEAKSHVAAAVSISACPGEFGDRPTTHQSELNEHCNQYIHGDAAKLFFSSTDKIRNSGCRLEVGKRYFMNVQFSVAAENARDYTQNSCYQRIGGDFRCAHSTGGSNVTWRKEDFTNQLVSYAASTYNELCSATKACLIWAPAIIHTGIISFEENKTKTVDQHQPYIGPCINQAPFPLNYNSMECGPSGDSMNTNVAYQFETADRQTLIECIDPEDNMPASRFASEIRNGKQRWLEGYSPRQPVYDNMVCSYQY